MEPAGRAEGAQRIRSPRAARQRIDRAAAEIAVAPEKWRSILNALRPSLGQPPLPAEVLAPGRAQFVEVHDDDGSSRSYPIQSAETLDGGGMNLVMQSSEFFTGRTIAVRKHLPAESAVEAAMRLERDTVIRERLTTLPRHPVIPRFWAAGMIDGERCEVFDFAPGISLAHYVRDHGLTYGLLLDFALHAARGVQYLHRQGLIHADIKPENFCVEERSAENGEKTVHVSLIDFDIVSTPEEQIRQYSLGNSLDGTLPYMPPENFRQDIPPDPSEARQMVFSKDIFALGLTLSRVLAGTFPKSFYTKIASLLEKKVNGDELDLVFPEETPPKLQVLISAMCASDWRQRPAIETVLRALKSLKEASTAGERRTLVTFPTAEEVVTKVVGPAVEHVGPYRMVNRSFSPRPTKDGHDLPLAEFEDPFGRKLVGVPFAFATREEERAFFDERAQLLSDLNAVRLTHPELFPGSFRDLVREERDGKHVVWMLRPLLEDAKDLRQFLEDDRPNAPVKERIAILRRTAEALSVLEEAGYVLPHITPELVFFVPQPAERDVISYTQDAFTRPIKRLFDVPSKEAGVHFRQELMGTSSARKSSAAEKGKRTVTDLLDIAQEIKVFEDLGNAERNFILQIAGVDTWKERLSILVWVEMQCG